MPKKITYEEFIDRSKDKHGDKFNYDNVNYINQYTPVKIKCPIHGYFEQIPKSHMNGNGCKKCSQLKIAEKLTGVKKLNKLDDKTIIDRLEKMYDYDYSKCKINGTGQTAVISDIICPVHGFFSKRLNNHLRQNQGCNLCGKNKLTRDIFTERSNIIHQNKYDYSKFEYINNREASIIICPDHGEFKQRPDKHLSGQGCPVCYRNIISKGEKFIRNFLISKNIKFEEQRIIPGTKLKMDFFLPLKNICIEYDGIQHFEPRVRFGGDAEFNNQKLRDISKNDYCKNNNIKLFRISYKDYSKLNSILDEILNESIKSFKEFVNLIKNV
jgi:very-short-patch-repair endonuclease